MPCRIGVRTRPCQRRLRGRVSPAALPKRMLPRQSVSASDKGSFVKHLRHLVTLTAAGLLGAATAVAQPPVAQPVSVRHSADERFAVLEHEYVTYILAEFPVVATYLGGAAFDPSLAAIDGRLRDYSPAAL